MSNTAEVTPYVQDDSVSPAQPGTSQAGRAAGLLSRSSADRGADDAFAEHRRAERLACARVTVLGNDLSPLVQAAADLGYRPIEGTRAATAGAPDRAAVHVTPRVELVNPDGLRLSLQANGPSISLEGTGPAAALQAVVRQRTLSAVSQHLRQLSGGQVQMRYLADGSVALQASEQAGKLSDGAATVSAIVGATGEVTVDIENIRGSRCEKVLDGLAKAVGGKARNKKLKPAYYQSKPGESTRNRTRI